MKILLNTAIALLMGSTAFASNVTVTDYERPERLVCEGEGNYGKSTVWDCQMHGNMAGLKIGVGVGAKLIGGQGHLTCNGYNRQGEVVACYNQKIEMGLIGVGKGIGLSVVRNLTVNSLYIDSIRNPQELMGTTFGFGGSVDLTALFVGVGAQANVTVSTRSGLGAEVGFSHGREFGLHAGAHVQGFVINKYNPNKRCGGERPMPDGSCPTGSTTNPFGNGF